MEDVTDVDRAHRCTDAPGAILINSFGIFEWLLVLGIVFLLLRILSGTGRKKVRYIDSGTGGSFRSDAFKIVAKPDLIENRKTIVEKKSRRRGVYDSDRKQLIATALAVRSKYPIREGYVVTQTQREFVDLSGSDRVLFSLIKTEHKHALMVANGIKPPPLPSRSNCGGCQFNDRCEYSAVSR